MGGKAERQLVTLPLEEGQREGALLATKGGLSPQRSAVRPFRRGREFNARKRSHPALPRREGVVNKCMLQVEPLRRQPPKGD